MFSGPAGTGSDERLFTSGEASRIAEVTLRQLQWWDERGAISPRQENKRRLYRPVEVLEIMIVAALRRKGVSLQKVRRVLRGLRRELARLPGLFDTPRLWLLTDGQSAFIEERPERIIERLTEARRPMYLLSLSEFAARIAAAPAPRRRSRAQLELF